MIAAPFFLSVQSAISPARLSQVIIAFFAMGMPLVLVICGFIYQRKISAARARHSPMPQKSSAAIWKRWKTAVWNIFQLSQKRLKLWDKSA